MITAHGAEHLRNGDGFNIRYARKEYAKYLDRRGLPPLLTPMEFEAPGWSNPPGRLFSILEMGCDTRLLLEASDDAALALDVHLFDMIAEAERLGGKSFLFGRQLTTALWNTDPPDVPIVDVPLPISTVFIVLPKDNESGIDYAVVTTLQGSSDPRIEDARALILAKRRINLHVVPRFNRTEPLWRVVAVFNDLTIQRYQGDLSMPLSHPMTGENTLSDAVIEEKDQRTCGFIWSLVAAISARPELLTPGSSTRIAKKSGGQRSQRTIVRPTLVGENYRVQHEDRGGSHASPRAHWVRGHFRNQACGPRWQEHRLIWIEPFIKLGGGIA